jgi:uncharacterized protein
MKKAVLLLCLVLIVILPIISAYDFPSAQNKYVNDFAGVLNSGDSATLQGLFAGIEANTTAQIVFVSLSTINGSDIGDYAVRLGRAWGVGQSDNNNGFVILYVADTGKIFAASGYGVEGILPDSKIGRLLDENYVPARDSGNLSSGILGFSNAVAQVMLANADEIKSGNASGSGSSGNNNSFVPTIVFIIIFIFFVRFLVALSRRKKGKKKTGFGWWWIPIFFPVRSSGSGFSGGGGFGGGGFGGGGGGFGGGGAGR